MPAGNRANYILSYIGTQSDKLPEAIVGMQSLLNDMPLAEANFANAKESIRNSIATERIPSLLFYLITNALSASVLITIFARMCIRI